MAIEHFHKRKVWKLDMSIYHMSLYQSGGKMKHGITKWREEIVPFRDKALFWHSVWQSAGRPLNTELHKIMKKKQKLVSFPDQEE